ncbi:MULTISPECIES: hypothetical protein [Paenibacillus]|uniref:hypothetical protein n=1 Tax=Paenibacillus TaxID=44249 RepID=UPI0022B88052|nr:hypothetical protein [Paenibacillus caseinilyticus]MCZ8524029.1 hypothetical protein [Paenibacillus caseinilyticus]
MNTQFMVWYGVLIIMHLAMNMKYWMKQTKGMLRLFLTLYAAVIGLYLAVAFGYKPPMPTQFFVERVSSALFSFIMPQEAAQ